MKRVASSRDFKKTCNHAFLDFLILDCKARVKDVEIDVSLECPEGIVRIRTREFDIVAKEPGEAFYEPSLENPLPSMIIVPRLRKALNHKRRIDRKNDLEKLASDILASLYKLCNERRDLE